MAEKDIVWFKEVGKKDIGLVGGKGANLGEMVNAGFPVPPGFIVTSSAYFNFIEETEIKEKILEKIKQVNFQSTEDIQKKSQEARNIIVNTEMSKELKNDIRKAYQNLGEKVFGLLPGQEEFVAVRSSATAEDLPGASFAGQQDTYLNIKGSENLLESVKKCWASLFTARAVYYRYKQGFPTENVGIAVVVQKMVNSEASGVMFTVDPTGTKDNMVIESVYGLGEAIVSGAVTPDHYVVEKKTVKLTDKQIAKQPWMIVRSKEGNNEKKALLGKEAELQKVSDEKILEIAGIGKKIEEHYLFPQDIEWAVEKGKSFIVQSRPITTLSKEMVQEIQKEFAERGLKPMEEKIEKKPVEKKITEFEETTVEMPLMEEKQGIASGIVEGTVLVKGISASPGIASGIVKIVKEMSELKKIGQGDVLVTYMTEPDYVPAMEKASAIVTDAGGTTAHAAIVSRELGIPCIVGTGNATEILKENQLITVNGLKGLVYAGKIEVSEAEAKALEQKKLFEVAEEKPAEKHVLRIEELTASEKDLIEGFLHAFNSRKVLVKVNVALARAAERASALEPEGIGLLRAEHLITKSGEHPAEFLRRNEAGKLKETLKEELKEILKFFKGKPVWYRTFDARTDEYRGLEGGDKEPKEGNPMLGWHGIRRSIDQPELIKAEFQAIQELHEEGYTGLGVMLPFVQHASEVQEAKKLAREAGLDLNEIDFGVMIETPAACMIIDELLKENIKFVSFGTNDLTQMTLGLDRNNPLVQKWFHEMHPAVMRLIKFVIDACKAKGIETSICGQAGSNPEMVRALVRLGIDSVSANIDAINLIKQTVLDEERQIILEAIRKEKK